MPFHKNLREKALSHLTAEQAGETVAMIDTALVSQSWGQGLTDEEQSVADKQQNQSREARRATIARVAAEVQQETGCTLSQARSHATAAMRQRYGEWRKGEEK